MIGAWALIIMLISHSAYNGRATSINVVYFSNEQSCNIAAIATQNAKGDEDYRIRTTCVRTGY